MQKLVNQCSCQRGNSLTQRQRELLLKSKYYLNYIGNFNQANKDRREKENGNDKRKRI